MDPLETKGGILHGVRQNDEGDVVVSLGVVFVSRECRGLKGACLRERTKKK